MRSVITFENGTVKTKIAEKEVIDCKEKQERELVTEKAYKTRMDDEKLFKSKLDDEKLNKPVKAERPSSLYAPKEPKTSLLLSESDKENKPKVEDEMPNKLKLTNRLNNSQAHLIDGSTNNVDKNALVHEAAALSTTKNTNDAMNNSRKLSLSLSKDALSYRNLLHPGSKNNIASNPPSPTKSYDGFGGSFNDVYIENLETVKQQWAPQGSEPNLEKTVSRGSDLHSYPSLSDMQVQFTSLAAQKILKGCPINSVDTLVEVNMAAADKPNNCDVTVHTDFGLVWISSLWTSVDNRIMREKKLLILASYPNILRPWKTTCLEASSIEEITNALLLIHENRELLFFLFVSEKATACVRMLYTEHA